MNVHAGISFTATVSNLFLGVYIYRLNPKKSLNKAIFFSLFYLSLWCFSEGLMRNASSRDSALLWTRISFLISSYIPAIFLLLVFILARSKGRWRLFFLFPPILLTLFILSDILLHTNLFISGVKLEYWGFYDEEKSFGYYLYILYLLSYFSSGLWILYKSYRSEGREEPRKKLYYILLCAPIPIIFGGCFELLKGITGFPAYPVTSLLTISYLLLFFGVGFHGTLFAPQPEDVSRTELHYSLEEKMSFLSFSAQANEVFLEMVNHGREGLLITTKDPFEVDATYGLKKTPIIFLTNKDGKHNVAPEDLSKLSYYIGEFLKESKKSIIFFDNIEPILERNGFNHTLRFLHAVNDFVVIYSSILLLHLREDTINEIQRNLLLREFTIIQKDVPRSSSLGALIRF